uniref:Uncharacterized protein n=1 Tax=Solanum lycopersicum TaxID=4081 RepID=A0A3Q7F0T6_SOLLC
MSSTLENNKCFFRDNNQKFLTLISQLVVLRLLSSGRWQYASHWPELCLQGQCSSRPNSHVEYFKLN